MAESSSVLRWVWALRLRDGVCLGFTSGSGWGFSRLVVSRCKGGGGGGGATRGLEEVWVRYSFLVLFGGRC
ncbi:hypothetical protein QBC45DRAFT_410691 [Copromyces sp. CBS 386.78]|nr:hypothetical protein QBC45DRAFT_410691 [Copromyces sp. CBS 386.78]